MVNWLNYRLFILALPLFLFFSFEQKKELPWGFVGHKQINRLAIFTLPPELFGFYKTHIEFITDHSVDPDKRRYSVEGEAECHYIDLDHYYFLADSMYPLLEQPWNKASLYFTEDTLKAYGIVPWHIQLMKYKLQKAFEQKNVALILKYSSEIGHYIADAHVPLHTTQNYNGQQTNQKGIHGLWESRLVELYQNDYQFFVGKSQYVENLSAYIWSVVKESHSALDTVFKMEIEASKRIGYPNKYSIEQRGNQTVKTYSKEFCQIYHQLMGNMVERRMRQAILAIGSIWQTAWIDAGQPDLNQLLAQKPNLTDLEHLNQLNQEDPTSIHGGRICD